MNRQMEHMSEHKRGAQSVILGWEIAIMRYEEIESLLPG